MLKSRRGPESRSRTTRSYRDFGWVEVDVVDPAAGEVGPAGRESLLDGLEGHVEVDDRVHGVGVVQGLGLRHRPGETWRHSEVRGHVERAAT